MKLKIYIGGNPGAQDGTEVDKITIKNLMSYVSSMSTTYFQQAIIPICIREPVGFKATNVTTKILNQHCFLSGKISAWPTDDFDIWSNGENLGTVGQTNVMFFLSAFGVSEIADNTDLFSISCVEDETA